MFRVPAVLALSGGFEDTLADVISWIAFIIVPVLAIAAFWLVHILPEKKAHKRHHPQKDAIQVMCLMSLLFGGLLWPLAFIWAYMKTPKIHVVNVTADADVALAAHAEPADAHGAGE